MTPRLAPACLALALGLAPAACRGSAAHGGDAGTMPPSPDGPALADAAADAPDAGAPPALVAVTPATWLHESVRLVFAEPIDPASLSGLTATVTLAGAPLSAQLALDGDRAVAVIVDPAARGLGELAVQVTGTVRDPGGRTAPVSAQTSAMLAPWTGLPIDRGPAASSPALAVTAPGGVLAAWLVGAAGARRVVAGLLDRGAWQPLGDPLGTSDAASPALALDGSGAPIVAWCDAGTAHVARWAQGAWSELASPGAWTAIALATPPGGRTIVAAVFGPAGAQVAALAAGDTWQPLGGAVALGGFTGEPQLAAASTTRVAIGWIDPGGTLRTARWEGTGWTALESIALGTPPTGLDRMSLAARGDTIAIAWDQLAGSFGVLAAELRGGATRWTRLGRTLDVDVQGEAIAPAIALDSTEHPIVAWSELIETAQRGVIARWDGTAWTIVGGPTWLPDGSAAPTRPALALHSGDAPVVGWSTAGAVGVARFDGPAAAGPGLAMRASLAGCSFSAASPPPRLSQTGCFTMTTPGRPAPHPGLVPYDVVVELWTDGARKRRWLAPPDGAAMTSTATGAWTGPPGTFVIKEFALETTPGNPATRRAVETRVLVRDATLGWQGFSYRWNAAGTDATLQPDAEQIVDWPMDDGSTHPYFYPSRGDCLICHDESYGPLLGVRAPQLARWFDYDGVIADQPRTLAALGVGPATNATPFISPHDPSATFEQRTRGYMAANCAHCHNPDHVAIHDLRYDTPLAQTNLCPDIVPGDAAASRVYQLVTSRPGMPPLGTLQVDPLAVQVLGAWIDGMTSCP